MLPLPAAVRRPDPPETHLARWFARRAKEAIVMRDLTLGKKITLGFSLLLALALGLGGMAAWQMLSVEKGVMALNRELVPEAGMGMGLQRSALLAMFEMRGYALSEDKAYLEGAGKYLGEVKQALAGARKLPHWNEDKLLQEKVAKSEAKVAEYEKLASETIAKNEAIVADRHEMDLAAESYIKESTDYLEDQNKALDEFFDLGASTSQVKDLVSKINMINEVIELGNLTVIAANKAQAERNPKLVSEALPNFDKINQKLDALKSRSKLAADLKSLEEARVAGAKYKQAVTSLVANGLALQDLNKRRNAAAGEVLEQARATAATAMKETSELAEQSADALTRASLVLLVGLAVALAVGCLLAFFLTRGITRPIRLVIEGLSEGASQVSSAASQVATASQQLAEGSSEQAASLEETSSSLEEMASMTKTNADNASQADHLMKEAVGVVARANTAMDELSRAMERITGTSDQTAKIVKTIDEIAFQTNLLALNAAVEAARAGEAGAGFAVVAEEVRNLAMRAAEAAKSTSALIQESIKNIKTGSDLVHTTDQAFGEVATSSAKVAELVGEIAAASAEQAQGIEQVNKAAVEMDKVTQQNAANAEESASASEELSAQAQTMQGFVEDMARMVGGTEHAAQAAKPGRPALPAPGS
jgi:methyl-accepting chemotaxis protein